MVQLKLNLRLKENTKMETPALGKRSQSSVVFIPICVLAVAWTLWAVFQMVMLLQEGSNLKALKANQEPTVQQAMKLRSQLDSIAAKTVELATKGNADARTVVVALKQRGITIDPNAGRGGK
jgi:hypothetical protein